MFTAVAPAMVAGCIDEDIRAWRRVADVKKPDTIPFQRYAQTKLRFGREAAR